MLKAKRFFKKTIWIVTLFLTIQMTTQGCQTPAYLIRDANRSIMDLRSVVISAIGQPRVISENQREFSSQYYPRKVDVTFDANSAKERMFSKVTILGDRRPYDIKVEVFAERRTQNGYSKPFLDLSRSKLVGAEVREKLSQSRDNRNFIDDVRPF